MAVTRTDLHFGARRQTLRVAFKPFIALLFSLGGGIIGAPAICQTIGTGAIQGTVQDPQGAVVANATVTALDPSTGRKTTVKSSSLGSYFLPALPPATYRVTAGSSGFQTLVQENVVVAAVATVTLDLRLSVGETNQTVNVTNTPPQLDTTNGTLETTLPNDVYTALPLALSNTAKSPLGFASLTPGESTGANSSLVLNGGPGNSSFLYINGVPVTSPELQGDVRDLNYDTSVELVDQFQIISTGVPAYYEGQGVVNLTLKSGTNRFHGDVYENIRNTAFDASGYFATTKQVEHQNEYGFSIGGPILKNKLFFYFNLDRYKLVAGVNPTITSIPTPAEQMGNFGAISVPIYDPASTTCVGAICTRTAFQGNIIPPGRISQIAKNLQAYLPGPTGSGIQNNYFNITKNGNNQREYSGKVDYTVTSRNQFSFLTENGSINSGTPLTQVLPLPYTSARPAQFAASLDQLGDTQTFRSNLVNIFSYQVNRYVVQQINPTTNLGDGAAKLGFVGIPSGQAGLNFPPVTFAGPNSPASWATYANVASFSRYTTSNTFQDNVQWILRKHNLTLGGQIIFQAENQIMASQLNTDSFSNSETAGINSTGTIISTTGNSYASFLLGAVDSASFTDTTAPETGARWRNYAAYVQDDWAVTKKLKVNAGLRYQIPTPFYEVQNKSSFLNPSLPNAEVDNYPGALQFAGNGSDSCNCRTLVKTHFLTLGPRVGFAYSATSRFVIRSSYSITHYEAGALGGNSNSTGTGLAGYAATPSFTSPNGGITPAFTWDNGFPSYTHAPFFQPTYQTGYNTTTGATGSSITYGDPDIAGRSPYTENWNLTLQGQLTSATTLSLSYTGSASHFLPLISGYGIYSNQLNPKYLVLGSLLNANETPTTLAQAQAIVPGITVPYANFQGSIGQMLRPFPQYSAVSEPYADYGDGHYDSLQVFAQHQMSHGLYLHFAYTWSKEIDDSGGENAYVGSAAASRTAYNLKIQRSVSTDPHHVFAIAYVYNLPFGKGHTIGGNNALLDGFIGGWRLAGSNSYSTGANLGSFSAACTLPNAGTCYADYNPTFTGLARINGNWGSGAPKLVTTPYLNVAAFQNPAPYTYGTTPRTAAYGLEGPASLNENVSLSKLITLREPVKLRLQIDAFNVLNRVVFGGINLNTTSTAFGTVSTQSNNPRQVQLEAYLTF